MIFTCLNHVLTITASMCVLFSPSSLSLQSEEEGFTKKVSTHMGSTSAIVVCSQAAAGTALLSMYIPHYESVYSLIIPFSPMNVNRIANYPSAGMSISKGWGVEKRKTQLCSCDFPPSDGFA